MTPGKALAALLLLASAAGADAASTWVVCADSSVDRGCRFSGLRGVQEAVDQASDGDTIRLRAGRYAPTAYRDITFGTLTIRGAVVIDQRRLSIAGDDGAVLDGSNGTPTSALVIRGGRVSLRDLTIERFRAASSEDDTYDGHGLFFIDSDADVEDVRIVGVAKMALTARGASTVRGRRLEILDGHVGIWLEETSQLELELASVRNNESAGICTYGHASARIRDSRFEVNRDDGLFADGESSIDIAGSQILRNDPYGVRAVGKSRITSTRNVYDGNVKDAAATEGSGRVIRSD